MRRLIEELDAPIPAGTVHVVGTNGKGSVAARVAAGLTAAGWRSGLFTSPHVEDFGERIVVDGVRIAPDRVLAEIERFRDAPALHGFGFFELTLALALRHFAAQGVEVAVLEAGIGARNDATNAVENRRLSLLTTVALDHRSQLGGTLAEIAADKLATVRPGVPLVSGVRGALAEQAAEEAERRGAPIHLERDGGGLFADPWANDPDGAVRQNRRLAAAALRLLGAAESDVRTGLGTAGLPARRERFSVSGRSVLLDGAHDPEAAARLREALTGPYLLVFGALARKQGAATLAPLATGAAWTVLTEAEQGDGRPDWAGDLPFEADPERALARALELCPPEGVVVIAGSLYLAGRVRPYLRRHRSDR
jgi:dihydrofolate synthase/folylpolyglutamate synthase